LSLLLSADRVLLVLEASGTVARQVLALDGRRIGAAGRAKKGNSFTVTVILA
jgi:hypothetical protein